ncbi:MAG: hypothetical protein JSV91_08315 [Phycisphaerales bacterium]|nr:MAG: hypothetical protein JSV91_08315 [Phycisphaerales bacterium]
MNFTRSISIADLLVCAALALSLACAPALAQNGRPNPQSPLTQGGEGGDPSGEGASDPSTVGEGEDEAGTGQDAPNNGQIRFPDFDGNEKAAFVLKEVTVEELIPFIVSATGKVVLPVNLQQLTPKKITIHCLTPVEKYKAIDLVFTALREHGIGVIEKDDIIIIDLMDNIMRVGVPTVLTADDDVMHRRDLATVVIKIYKLEEVEAEAVGDTLSENIPDHAKLTIDANSNQIVVKGTIEFCQQLQQVINALDRPWIKEERRTFKLAYADASDVANNIYDLFEEDTRTTGGGRTRQPQRGGRQPGRPPSAPTLQGPLTVELRVTVNVQQNTVTVSAAPKIIEEIAKLITEFWDRPRSDGTAKVYTLEYTDCLKVRDTLQELLGQSTGAGRGRAAGGRTGAGGPADVQEILGGIYRIEAYPDTNSLVVVCKTEESFGFLDQLIDELDQPSDVGLPVIIELKHAYAVSLAEELNALLAPAGSNVTIDLPEEGLTAPSLTDGSGGAGGITTGGSTGGGGGTGGGTMNFPWQRGGGIQEEIDPSSLIGKVRIVPIVRRNALAILAPPSHMQPMTTMIEQFDKPGRQVMIEAIIAEVELTDELALGIRISSSEDILGGAYPDFRLGGGVSITGTEDQPFKDIFDTSTLDANISVNAVVQALAQRTNVRILQEPRIYTADNQEALFFDGQRIPFITNTTINSQGNPTSSFDYQDVGVILNVRPRITVERDVDLEVALELSSVVPGQTLFGGAIIDRRRSETHLVVRNGQTIVLSGILRETESVITRGLPILSDIPIIGELFKSRENSRTTTELVAFITPYVVDNPTEHDTNFQRDEVDRLEEFAKPVNKQAADWRKNPTKYSERILEDRLKDRQPEDGEEPQEIE